MYCYSILNTKFRIFVDDEKIVNYVDSFLSSYSTENTLPISNIYEINVYQYENPITIKHYLEKKIHSSKHDYWNIYGRVVDEMEPKVILWPYGEIIVEFIEEKKSVNLKYRDSDKVVVGECLFHVLRSIALFERDCTNSCLVHASAVKYKNQGLIFMGNASAGKTTLLLHLVNKLSATPISNDRVLLSTSNNNIIANSWPSYFSICEGTILEYDELIKEDRFYNSEECKFRTQIWNEPLRKDFSKDKKRIYPMNVLCRAFGTKYIHNNKLDYIFFTKIDVDIIDSCINKLNVIDDKNLICEILEQQSFNLSEKSFHPWLIENLNTARMTTNGLYKRIIENGVEIYEIKINPNKLNEIDGFIMSLNKGV